jgi:hypothetical protein
MVAVLGYEVGQVNHADLLLQPRVNSHAPYHRFVIFVQATDELHSCSRTVGLAGRAERTKSSSRAGVPRTRSTTFRYIQTGRKSKENSRSNHSIRSTKRLSLLALTLSE